MIGTRTENDLAQNYRIGEILGTGGFAKVFQSLCLSTGEIVALKQIDVAKLKAGSRGGSGAGDGYRRLLAECEIHASLKHDNIIRLYKTFQEGDFVYLVLEYCDGGDLQRYLDAQITGYLGEDNARHFFVQIVDAVVYLHSLRVAHRDLKLSNVLLTTDGKAKICDFGLAFRFPDGFDKTNTMCGTAVYMSPEAATNAAYGLETDVFSLGCILYTLLVGRPPFDAHSVQSVLTNVVMAPVIYPQRLSPTAKDLISKLLMKDPRKRIKLSEVLSHPFMLPMSFQPTTASVEPSFVIPRIISPTRPFNYQPIEAAPKNLQTFPRSNTQLSATKEGQLFGNARTLQSSNSHHHHQHNSMHSSHSHGSTRNNNNVDAHNSFNTRFHQHGYYDNHDAGVQQVYCENRVSSREERPIRSFERVTSSQPPTNGERAMSTVSATSKKSSSANVGLFKPIDPLNTQRLKPQHLRAKNIALRILDDGEVCVEFLKRRPSSVGSTSDEGAIFRVVEVCRVSGDGQWMVVYSGGNCAYDPLKPPPLPHDGTKDRYSISDLPQRLWNKYEIAFRFVRMVREKTAKIIVYEANGNVAILMENGDFEAKFVNTKERFKRTRDGVVRRSFSDSPSEVVSNPEMLSQWPEVLRLHQRCITLEEALAKADPSTDLYPAIFGKRSLLPTVKATGNTDSNSPTVGGPLSKVSFACKTTFSASPPCINSGTVPAPAVKAAVVLHSISVGGVGVAKQFTNGELRMTFNDQSELSMLPAKDDGGVYYVYRDSSGSVDVYKSSETLPTIVAEKLWHLEKAIDGLRSRTESEKGTRHIALSNENAPYSGRQTASTNRNAPFSHTLHSLSNQKAFVPKHSSRTALHDVTNNRREPLRPPMFHYR